MMVASLTLVPIQEICRAAFEVLYILCQSTIAWTQHHGMNPGLAHQCFKEYMSELGLVQISCTLMFKDISMFFLGCHTRNLN